MPELTLAQAQTIVQGALTYARHEKLMPLLVAVFDARASLTACAAEDGTSLGRFDIARGKANGALALGMGSRAIAKRAGSLPALYQAFGQVIAGGMVPGPGGVLIRDADGNIVGSVGISGDVGDRDEAAAIAGIAGAGLAADPGEGG